jgi:hypothetical protein
MVTPRAVTRPNTRKLSRTASDAQPIPRSTPPSGYDARRLGLNDASKVVQWLNASKGTSSYSRVVRIHQELQDLPLEFSRNTDAYIHRFEKVTQLGEAGTDWPKEKIEVQRKIAERHVALNQSLSQYVFRPRATYIIAGYNWLFGMVPDEKKRWFKIKVGQETISEADAVMALVRLAESGDLGRLQRCEMCKERWHVAAKRNYRFCSDECRENFYAKAPDYHSRKAANQRKYRENLKRAQAAQALAWREGEKHGHQR